MVYANDNFIRNAEPCFFGSTWDWDQYTKQLEQIHLYPASARHFSFKNDFENASLTYDSKITDSISNSGNWCGVLDKDHATCGEHTAMVWEFNGKIPEWVRVWINVKKVNPGPIDALIVCSFIVNDTVRCKLTQKMDPFMRHTTSWFNTFADFRVPKWVNGDTWIRVYVWNVKGDTFFVDDIKINYD